MNKTRSGLTCLPWKQQKKSDGASGYWTGNSSAAAKGVGNHRYCRNPDVRSDGAWCYTTNGSRPSEACDVGEPKASCSKMPTCTSCTQCGPSHVETASCTNTSDTSCSHCGVGKYANKTSGACEACPRGSLDGDNRSSTPCIPCKICGADEVLVRICDYKTVDTQCKPCKEGETWANKTRQDKESCDKCQTCDPDQREISFSECRASSNTRCLTCPGGTYANQTKSDQSKWTCVPCVICDAKQGKEKDHECTNTTPRTCKDIMCANLSVVQLQEDYSNATVQGMGNRAKHNYGAKASVRCDPGFTGGGTIQCLVTGNWTAAGRSCDPSNCPRDQTKNESSLVCESCPVGMAWTSGTACMPCTKLFGVGTNVSCLSANRAASANLWTPRMLHNVIIRGLVVFHRTLYL